MRDVILRGECVEQLKRLPDKSVDLIFADPPYFMQTAGELLRVEGGVFDGVSEEWDSFADLAAYDEFSLAWLTHCRRVLKDNGGIWVIGSFQNIFRLGYLMQNLGFWIINDVIWHKSNPVPNFRGTRLCNAHETLIFAVKSRGSKYSFNYKTMKFLNGGKQEKSIWQLALCTGAERLKKASGVKLHPTQKPEALLEKIILATSKFGDLILDPFFGTGTTGAVARRLGRHYIGIEREEAYVAAAEERIAAVRVRDDEITRGRLEIKPPRVSLRALCEAGFLRVGQGFFDKNKRHICDFNGQDLDDGSEILGLHKMAAKALGKANHNGWDYFYVFRGQGEASGQGEADLAAEERGDFVSINSLRYRWAGQTSPAGP